jgi:uncharacterized protein YhjY with autotransporter beta-barrel domain
LTVLADQTITFNNPGAKKFGTTPTLTATASSGLAVTFTSATTGVCTITNGGVLTFVTTGTCVINANQAGNANYAAAVQVQQSFNVGKRDTTSTLVTSGTRILGQNLTLTATVAPSVCTGTVAFKDGTTTLGTGTLSSGSASFSTTSLTAGSHSLTVEYGGDSTCNSSTSSVVSATITNPATTITLTASGLSVLHGQPVTFTATVSPSAATGIVTFKEGITTLGTGTLSGGTATFTTSALSPGAHSIIAIYGGDSVYQGSTSSVLSLSISRPNPASDPRIRGVVTAQASAVQRSVTTNIQHVHQRLETLHDDDVPAFSNGLSVSGSNSCTIPASASAYAQVNPRMIEACGGYAGMAQMMAYAPPGQPMNGDPLTNGRRNPNSIEAQMARFHDNGDKKKPGTSAVKNNPFNIWTSGSVMIGYDPLSATPNKLKVSMSGVTVGVDTKLFGDLKGGLAVTFSSDRTDIGTDGTRSRGQSLMGSLYSSWKVFDHVFVDGLVGYGATKLNSHRFDDNANGFIYGSRDARAFFGSVTLSYDRKYGPWRVAPYARLDLIVAELEPYTETGDANWILSYDRMRMNSQSVVAGIRGEYAINTDWGTISPIMRFEYRHMFSGNLSQSMSYVADPSTNYTLLQTGTSRDTIMATVGLKAADKGQLSGGVEYMISSTTTKIQSQGMRGQIKLSF